MGKGYNVTIEFTNGRKTKFEAVAMSMHEGYAMVQVNDSIIYYIPYTNILMLRTEEGK